MDNLWMKEDTIRGIDELKFQNEVWEIIFENASDCIVVVDPDGYVAMINNAYANFLGINPDEAIGRHVTEVIDNTRLHIVIKTGKAEMGQLQRIKNNDSVTLRIPIIKNNKVIGAIGKVIFKDVREVELLYRSLESAKKELYLYKERFKKVKGDYYAIDNIIGKSLEMRKLKSMVTKVANRSEERRVGKESGSRREGRRVGDE